MKGTLIATAHWEALDRPGRDTCKLIAEPSGWMLVGRARFTDGGDDARLDYVVRCAPDWRSLSGDVSGRIAGRNVGWRLTRDDGGWRLDGIAVPGTARCHDIDLGFTPATNLLPVRRLSLHAGSAQDIDALWFRVPQGRAEVLRQTYERLDAWRMRYRSPGFGADLTLHSCGFVTDYPDGWRGTVDAD